MTYLVAFYRVRQSFVKLCQNAEKGLHGQECLCHWAGRLLKIRCGTGILEVAEKGFGGPASFGRGSESCCKHVMPILIRARRKRCSAFFSNLILVCDSARFKPFPASRGTLVPQFAKPVARAFLLMFAFFRISIERRILRPRHFSL